MSTMIGVLEVSLGVLIVVLLVGGLVYWYVQDITQKKHAILGNREEMPFNRATRGWVYRLAKNEGGVIGFGSTYDLHQPGALLFVNAGFPVLEEDQAPTPPLVIGEGYAA